MLLKMRRFNNLIKYSGYFIYRWISPVIDPLKAIKSLINYPGFFRDIINYSKKSKSEPLNILDIYPALNEKTPNTSFDSHYFYQDIWAFKKIYQSKVKTHYDIGSSKRFVGFLTAFSKVVMVDIRPLKAKLENLKSEK